MKKVTAIMVGAGGRGAWGYGVYGIKYPDEIEFIAVAEPDDARRKTFGDMHHIPEENRYTSWEQMLAKPKMADALFVCTMDKLHYEPSKAGMEKGYHVLVEKPMSPDAEECVKMGELSEKYPEQIFMVGHVLRFTPFFARIKELLVDKRIGRVIGIQHNENVEFWHAAHSYVRGPWRNSEVACNMLLSKSCHDLDILVWLTESECEKISSFGSLQYFKRENAPEGSASRCVDCQVEENCPYSVKKIYLCNSTDHKSISTANKNEIETNATHMLYESPFGRCVFHCDNNVVDHQVVNIVFKNGIIADFLMGCFTSKGLGRTIKIMGTHGEITGFMGENKIIIDDFVTQNKEVITVTAGADGHGGGDEGIMRHFVKQVRANRMNALTSAKISVESHLMCFAAEEARLNDKVIYMDEYKSKLKVMHE